MATKTGSRRKSAPEAPSKEMESRALPDDLITESSGNVFADLGFDKAEAASLLMRSDLMIMLREHIRSEGWTQAEAARRLGIHQPRVSDLMRGRVGEFSLDALVDFLSRVDVQLEVRPRRARPAKRRASPVAVG